MQDYIELICSIDSSDQELVSDILIAQLVENGFESFELEDDKIKAYIPESEFDKNVLHKITIKNVDFCSIEFQYRNLKNKNWNEEWEKNFQPIVVEDKCHIKAPFHPSKPDAEYEITIMPKMSFGTGHHPSTYLIIQMMMEMNFTGKKVLDMGCGTGILAILAEMTGAEDILAVDNNDWAYDNAVENFTTNNCQKITALLGDRKMIKGKLFDIILANINRNVLLEDIKYYKDSLLKRGTLVVSGILKNDLAIIKNEAISNGFKYQDYIEKENWVAIHFIK